MATSNKIISVPRVTFDSASLTGSYQSISAGGIPNPVVVIRFVNDSDADFSISFDGATDHDIVLAGTEHSLNATSLFGDNARGAQFAQGTKIYVKGSAGTGLFYVVGYNQK